MQGRYRIVRQLGQGGMGAVYEAVDQRLDSTVALKETLFADERLRKQFEREARLLARMHHPALPRVSDHFSEDDGQFLVMQFIAGGDLAEMIALKRGPFPAVQVATWADQLLDALDYLHTQDPPIIHRDIKPQNLKLTERGQIILLDFGLAKGQASEISRITMPVSVFGYTPNYAPLEQIQGLGTDARSDIYALAATLYHLMTGVKPPDALTRAAAIVNGQVDPLRPANKVNNLLSPALAGVLERAMAQNRDRRYANAAEMRKALQEAGTAAAVGSRSEANTVLFPPSAPAFSGRTMTSARQATSQSDETTVVGRAPAPQKKRYAPWALAAASVLVLGAGVFGFYAYQHKNGSASIDVPALNNPESSANQNQTGEASTATDISDDIHKVEDEKQQVAADEKLVKKQEKAVKQKEAPEKKSPVDAADRDAAKSGAATQQNYLSQPVFPHVNPPDVPRLEHLRGQRGADGVTIRNFPDGTQLIIAPDGSRVVVRPDGSRRFFRPGERINRRRVLPRP